MQTNFIDSSKWNFYNKVYNYCRTKRMAYVDEIEAKQIREAAPLVKFTYKKSVRAAEQEMLQHLLTAADHMQADAVIVSHKCIQLMCHRNKMLQHLLSFNLMAPGDHNKYFVNKHDPSCRMVQVVNDSSWYGRDSTLTPVDSEIDAMYIKRSDAWVKTTSRETIINTINEMGFVSRPGRPPTAVASTECSIESVDQINDVLDVCEKFGSKSKWSTVLIKEAQKILRDYRTPGAKALISRINSIIITKKK